MLKLLSVFILWMLSTAAFALNAPAVTMSRLESGQIKVSYVLSDAADGFNVFLDKRYYGTYAPSNDNVFLFEGGAGHYCVSSFATVAGSKQYSPCSAGSNIPALAGSSASSAAFLHFKATLYSVTAAELFWSAPNGATATQYQLYRDGSLLASLDGKSYFEGALQAGVKYRYKIVALSSGGAEIATSTLELDTASYGNGSQHRNTMDSTQDAQAPSSPTGFRGEIYSGTAAELFWDAAPADDSVVSYEVYRNNELVKDTNGRSYFDGSRQNGVAYTYKLKARNNQGQYSAAVSLQLGQGQSQGQAAANTTPLSSSDKFSISLDAERYVLQEGDTAGVFIPISLSRELGYMRGIDLSLRAENDADLHSVNIHFEPATLASFVSGSTLNVSLSVAMAPITFHERRFILVARDGEEVEEKLVVFDVKPVKAPDVYLLAGQSNMEGSSEHGAKQSYSGGREERNERIRQLNVRSNSVNVFDQDWKFIDEYANVSEPRYIPAEDPLHEPRSPVRTIKEATFIGMGNSFAKAALANTTQEIYLVPAAWSATGFCTNELSDNLAWNAEPTPEPDLGGTLLADRALTRLNMTLRQTGGVFRGILWHQGEADSNNVNCAYKYEQNLQKLVARIRTEALVDARGVENRGQNANIPFIVGTMSRGRDFRASLENFGALKSHVDSVHRGVGASISHADFVNNDDLVPPAYPCGEGSCIHFGASAYREMGARYYEALQRINNR